MGAQSKLTKEARRVSAQRNKSDAADALGIAHHAHRLVPQRPCEERGLLQAVAAADAEEAQVPGRDNTIRHSLKALGNLLKRTGTRRLCCGDARSDVRRSAGRGADGGDAVGPRLQKTARAFGLCRSRDVVMEPPGRSTRPSLKAKLGPTRRLRQYGARTDDEERAHIPFAALASPPRTVLSPVESRFGTSPSQAPKSRPFENAVP